MRLCLKLNREQTVSCLVKVLRGDRGMMIAVASCTLGCASSQGREGIDIWGLNTLVSHRTKRMAAPLVRYV